MKKVLLIHTHGGIGGAGQSLLDIVKILKDMSIDLYVACPQKPTTMIDELKRMDVKVVPLDKILCPLPHYSGVSITNFNLRYWMFLLKVVTDGKRQLDELEIGKYDAVLINSSIYAWITRYLPKNVSCFCFHRETYMGAASTFRNRILMRDLSRCKGVAFISEFDLKKTIFRTGNAKKYLIPDAVDVDYYNRIGTSSDNLKLDRNVKYILFVGGHNWIKGGNVIIRAMKYIEDENIKLIFVPSSKEKRCSLKSVLNPCSKISIDKLIKKYRLENRVIFFPAQIDMAKFYMRADIVVFPSVVAHQARPIYEAGACHKTIIITDFEETKENLIDGFNGITFRRKDSYMLASIIKEVLSNRNKMLRMGDNNYKMTLEKHNMINYNKEIMDFIYEGILDEN